MPRHRLLQARLPRPQLLLPRLQALELRRLRLPPPPRPPLPRRNLAFPPFPPLPIHFPHRPLPQMLPQIPQHRQRFLRPNLPLPQFPPENQAQGLYPHLRRRPRRFLRQSPFKTLQGVFRLMRVRREGDQFHAHQLFDKRPHSQAPPKARHSHLPPRIPRQQRRRR
ncbi:unnamed protein product [Linum tenue]|uniref:Uncharacterized protein n=1 Tax=Linum tenue TaxID=586396 RepID=A0AAV0S522_9ROSI|nr:unnamed protein product [Linum tenue]